MTFEKTLTYAHHLGLYSEEIALTGEQIDNFAQAFTHLALIDAAIALDRQIDPSAARAPARPVSIPVQRAGSAGEMTEARRPSVRDEPQGVLTP